MRRLALPFSALLGACAAAMPPSAPSPALGQPLNLTLPSDRGDLVSVPLAGAKVTVLDGWSPKCEPCKKTLPELWSRRRDIEAAGGKLVLVGVLAESEDTNLGRKTLVSWGVSIGSEPAPFLVDRGDALGRAFGTDKLPLTAVLDDKGVLRWVGAGEAGAGDVVAAARTVAGE